MQMYMQVGGFFIIPLKHWKLLKAVPTLEPP